MKLTVVTAKQSVYFNESKRSWKSCSDEHKRSVRNYDCEKKLHLKLQLQIEIVKDWWEADHKSSWDQKNVADRENKLTPKEDQRKHTFFKES